jgi:hypothetical protein
MTRKGQVPKEYKDLNKTKKKIQNEWKKLRKIKIENRAVKEMLQNQKPKND